jgi:hypothetical protein
MLVVSSVVSKGWWGDRYALEPRTTFLERLDFFVGDTNYRIGKFMGLMNLKTVK